MKWVETILAEYIRRGVVSVNIPGLTPEGLREAMHGEADRTLREVIGIVFDEMSSDEEKVQKIQELLS